MKFASLAEWLDYLEQHLGESRIEMGLGRVGAVADTMGLRKPAQKCVLVAGTNGKGSTCVFIEALFLAAGFTVGCTLSPHLHAFNERVRVDGLPASDQLIALAFNAVEQARQQTRSSPHLSYFEFAFLAALKVFKDQEVDICVLEVGLGGRLDAANLVHPDVSVITSIGIDHEDFLGHEREVIAIEKAGIMRRDIVCVYGEPDMPQSIGRCARESGAKLLRSNVDFTQAQAVRNWSFIHGGEEKFSDLPLPSISVFNASTAIEATLQLIPLTREIIARACTTVDMPGRFEKANYRGLKLLIDVAHNPHAAEFLKQMLSGEPVIRTVCIAGFLAGKDVSGIVRALKGIVDEWVFVDTGYPANMTRAQTGTQSANLAMKQLSSDNPRVNIQGSVKEALIYYLNATHLPDRVVIMGSFDVVQKTHDLLKSEN